MLHAENHKNYSVYMAHIRTVHCTCNSYSITNVHVQCVCMHVYKLKRKKTNICIYIAATTCLKLHVVDIPTSVLSCLLCSVYIRSVLELWGERLHIFPSEAALSLWCQGTHLWDHTLACAWCVCVCVRACLCACM